MCSKLVALNSLNRASLIIANNQLSTVLLSPIILLILAVCCFMLNTTVAVHYMLVRTPFMISERDITLVAEYLKTKYQLLLETCFFKSDGIKFFLSGGHLLTQKNVRDIPSER